jgi:hypothetical protein
MARLNFHQLWDAAALVLLRVQLNSLANSANILFNRFLTNNSSLLPPDLLGNFILTADLALVLV